MGQIIGTILAIIIFFIFLPLWERICGYIFGTREIIRLLKEQNEHLKELKRLNILK